MEYVAAFDFDIYLLLILQNLSHSAQQIKKDNLLTLFLSVRYIKQNLQTLWNYIWVSNFSLDEFF